MATSPPERVTTRFTEVGRWRLQLAARVSGRAMSEILRQGGIPLAVRLLQEHSLPEDALIDALRELTPFGREALKDMGDEELRYLARLAGLLKED